MSRVVVCGAGVVGLATALLLARDGHEVTVLEADPQPPPPGPVQAWDRWERRGVAQFRQPHNLFPRFQQVLDRDLPDVTTRLVSSGCVWVDPLAAPPRSLTDRSARPGDERFRFLTGRRPVVEAAFAAAARDEPGLVVRRGVVVAGLVADDAPAPPVRVRGVRTGDGQVLPADLVVDATGRAARGARELAGAGAAPRRESQDRGFVYYSRFFRGSPPDPLAPPLSPLGSISLLTILGDGDTWSVTVFGTSGDRPLRQLREDDRFDALLRACPLHAQWLAGEALTGVLPMAGVVDRYHRFVVDGVPVATGLLAVGDAWACTNPSGGRGLSVGLAHAQLLRDLLREHPVVDDALSLAWDATTEQGVTPFYRMQQRQDRERIGQMEAVRDGTAPPAPDPVTARLGAALLRDPDAFRAALDLRMCLALPEEVLARPAVVRALAAAAPDEPTPLPGPSRQELVALLTA